MAMRLIKWFKSLDPLPQFLWGMAVLQLLLMLAVFQQVGR
jgi:hypothetical protein